jgi:tetratricopeptide (TPR) repeat protein
MSLLERVFSLLRVERESFTFGDRQGERLRRELQAGRWEPAAEFLEQLKDWDARDFYVEALTNWPGRPQWLDDWMRQRPGSTSAWLMRGVHSMKWAWEARGSGYAETVSPQGFELFFERLAQAEAELYRAAELDPDDPTPWAALVMVGVGAQVGREQLWERFEQAIRRYPHHWRAHVNMLQGLCDKWGGSHEQMFDFVRSVSGRLPEGHPLHVLIPMAHYERMRRYERENDVKAAAAYFHRPDVGEEITEAARRSVHSAEYQPSWQYPVELNYFAFAFYGMGQRTQARQLFRRIGPWITLPWGPVDEFLNARRKCRSAPVRVGGLWAIVWGTNLVGLAAPVGVFLSLGEIQDQLPMIPEGVVNLAGGLLVLGFDLAYRKAFIDGSLVDWDGGRFLHFPLWLWGVAWTIAGLVQVAMAAFT